MPNFSSLARLEMPEKFLRGGGVEWGRVCKVIFMSNPTVVLRLGWGFDNFPCGSVAHQETFFRFDILGEVFEMRSIRSSTKGLLMQFL